MLQPNIFWRHSRSAERAVVEHVASGMRAIKIGQGKLSATLQLRPIPRCAVNPMLSIHVTGTIDGQAADMFIPPAILDRCLEAIAPGLSAAKLDAASTALMLEAALADQLDSLERELGVTIAFSKAELCRDNSARWAKPDIALRLDMERSAPAPVYAYVQPDVARKVYSACMKAAGTESFKPILSLAVRAGVVRLSSQEIASLQPDDLVMLDECSLHNKQVYLIADEATGARASISGSKMKLIEPMAALVGSWLAPFVLSARKEAKDDQVAIAVDIVRRTVSFDDLEVIDLESEIDLPQGIDGIVGLYQGTRKIASGNLIIAGSTIGVRIIELNANG